MRRITGVRVAPEPELGMQLPPGAAAAASDVARKAVATAVPAPAWASSETFWYRYRIFLGGTAAAHFVSGVATTVIIFTTNSDWPTRVCASYSVWNAQHPGFPCFQPLWNSTQGVLSSTNSTGAVMVPNLCNRYTAWKHAGSLNPSWMVAAFFFLSFVFQIPPVLPEWMWKRVNYEVYKKWLAMGVQPLRFIEYSISSTLMILIIALLDGATDLWLLLSLAAANWCCMMFGLFHEQLLRLRAERMELGVNFFDFMGAHLAGWVPFVAVWTVLTSEFEWSLNAMQGVPAAVKSIPPVQLFMFALFGLNQMLGSLSQRQLPAHAETPSLLTPPSAPWEPRPAAPAVPPRRMRWTYMHSEVAYTVLSLTAKSLLAWTLLGGTINQDPSKLVSHSLC